MRIVLTIDDKEYGHIPPDEIREYIHYDRASPVVSRPIFQTGF